MITTLSLPDFIHASKDALVIDVRTPAEFEQGHIIGATNLPLFTNDERVLVGTCYKQQGRQPAILLGFELIGGGALKGEANISIFSKSLAILSTSAEVKTRFNDSSSSIFGGALTVS